MKRKDFVLRLVDSYPKRPELHILEEYKIRLGAWRPSEKDLDRLFDLLTERHVYFPALAELCQAALDLGISSRPRPREVAQEGFTVGGVRYFRSVPDVSNRSPLPEGATDYVLAIPRSQRYDDEMPYPGPGTGKVPF